MKYLTFIIIIINILLIGQIGYLSNRLNSDFQNVLLPLVLTLTHFCIVHHFRTLK